MVWLLLLVLLALLFGWLLVFPRRFQVSHRKTAYFLHPNLGIGGAERLMLDLALGVRSHYEVTFFTNFYTPLRCFPECHEFSIKVYPTWLPVSLFGQFHALCAYLKSLWAALRILGWPAPDVLILDGIPVGLPLLRACLPRQTTLLFYCHFPDKLLASRSSWLRVVYRLPIDLVEDVCMSFAHQIVVNSRFTQMVFRETLRISGRRFQPQVLYPCYQLGTPNEDCDERVAQRLGKTCFFLSINRFEAKKNLGLAIDAFVIAKLPKDVRLVLCGGFDPLVPENLAVLQGLQLKCQQADLPFDTLIPPNLKGCLENSESIHARVIFLPSITNGTKNFLIGGAAALVYTPSFEHLGIVPLEAMAQGCWTIAVNNGGPCETVSEDCGFLCEAEAQSFGAAMLKTYQKVFLETHDQRTDRILGMRQLMADRFGFDRLSGELLAILSQAKPSRIS